MPVEIFAMTCGWLTMPMPFLIDGTDGVCRIPIPAYLIRHPRGTVLFDSGMSLRVQRDGAKALGPELEPHFETNEEVSARLAAIAVNDEAAMRASLQRLRALRQRGARMIYGYDPEFWADIPQSPHALG